MNIDATILVPGPVIVLNDEELPLTGVCIGHDDSLLIDGVVVGRVIRLGRALSVRPETHTSFAPNKAPVKYTAQTQIDCVLYFETRDPAPEHCTCPRGWGDIKDSNCPRHGKRDPRHVVAGG